MILSRNWLNEFVDLKDITDKEFNDEMTLSGSKVETIERPDENLKNVVVGKILEMKRHENSDHMWVCQIDVGQAEPVQIVTGAWNIHVGDYVPAALHGAHLPGGVKIEKGKLRGVESNGMLCSLKELGMTAEHDFPYAIITPAALLNDYHPIDPAKPSIPADIKPGDKVYGPVLCGRVEAVESTDGGYDVRVNDGTVTRAAKTACSNLHEGDLVAYNTKSDTICTLEDLHATPCILISPPARRESEREFYMNTLGFGGSFVFAENLEDGRLLVAGNRGFLPVDNAGTLPPAGAGSARVPIYRCGSPLTRNYCAFWPKERGGYYVEVFAALLRRLLSA